MAVIVARLNTGQAMRLKVASYFSTNAMGRKKRLDTGANADGRRSSAATQSSMQSRVGVGNFRRQVPP